METANHNNLHDGGLKFQDIFRNKRIWLGAAAVLVIVLGGLVIYQYYYAPATAEVATSPEVQTAVARRGDLIVFASGAGSVVPAAEVGVGFDESGTLNEILVNVGEQVQAGQVLARLQTNKTEEEILLSIADAELNVLTAQQAFDDINSSSQMDAAEALLAVEEAEQALEDLQNTELRVAQVLLAVAEAEDAVKQSERSYWGTRSPADANTIAAANAELVLATKALNDQEEKYNDYANKPDNDLEKANAQLKLSQAQAAYDSAVRYYNAVTGTGSELDLELSEAELATAQAELALTQKEYERVAAEPTPGEIALAEAQLAVAKANYDTLKNGADPAEVALAEANLANAKAKLAVALEDQAVIDLVASLDSTLMSIDASVGETVGTNAIITLADLSHPLLTVYLDETDLDKVAVGYEVEVVFDSLPDITFTGHVTEVNPSLQTISGASTVMAQVQLDVDSFSKHQSLPVGSNASVEVIGGRADNAVLVPVEAVRELGPDEYAVFVMEDGEPKLRIVSVGLMDYTSAEIISGLEPGDIVTTGVVETN
jgi:multidrug efflux pump subunit AcrA (membrane-fusion protein)